MMKFKKTVGAAVVIAALLATLSGCQKQEGPFEKAGQKVDKAADKAAEKIDQAGQKIDQAAEKVGEKVEKAGEKIQDAATSDKK